MKNFFAEVGQFFRTYLTELKRHFWAYVLLFVGMNMFLMFIIIPIFTSIAELVMRLGGIPYVSYNNLTALLTQHPLGLLGLFVLLIILLLVVYAQFSFQFIGVKQIQSGVFTFRGILAETGGQLRRVNLRLLLFFLAYFLLILPFSRYVFATPLLAKIQIPEFTMEFFLASWQNLFLLVVVLLAVYMIGRRFILVLPYLILEQITVREAIKKSLANTRSIKKMIGFFVYFAIILMVPRLIVQAIFMGLYQLQHLLDHTSLALVSAVIIMAVVEMLNYLLLVITGMLVFSFLMSEMGYLPKAVSADRSKQTRRRKIVITSLSILMLAAIFLANTTYMLGWLTSTPMTISHRGVDDENGVQNTIPALLLTAKEKPDFVEMDVQETKDKQFVVFHDNNLQKLAGVNNTVQQMTLAQLTKLKVHENDHTAPLASFSDYLSAATKAHQKLLVEIKITATDPETPSALTKRFLNQYGEQLIKNGDRMHSLDYTVVQTVKENQPQINVSFILPFNVLFPNTPANSYTMEATTLNYSFVEEAHKHNQQVYAWTVNDPTTMQMQMLNGVDAIITDHLSQLKTEIKDYQDHPTYAQRLKMFMNILPAPGSSPAN